MLICDFFHVDCAVTLQRIYVFFVLLTSLSITVSFPEPFPVGGVAGAAVGVNVLLGESDRGYGCRFGAGTVGGCRRRGAPSAPSPGTSECWVRPR